jgi:hypothetical protein
VRWFTGTLTTALLIPVVLPGQTGAISGTVRLDGEVRARGLLKVTVDQEFCGNTVEAQDVVVSQGRLANAVAYLEGLEGDVPSQEYSLTNVDCRFDPPVLVASVGSQLVVSNADPMMHNTHLNLWYGSRTRTVANLSVPQKRTLRTARPLRRAGLIDIECDVHPWMHAKLWVFDHPYFASSDETGSFEIPDVPVGSQRVKVWHEVFGEKQVEVTVRANETTVLEVVYRTDDGEAPDPTH